MGDGIDHNIWITVSDVCASFLGIQHIYKDWDRNGSWVGTTMILHRDQFGWVGPSRSKYSGRHSSRFHWNTQAPSPRQGAVQRESTIYIYRRKWGRKWCLTSHRHIKVIFDIDRRKYRRTNSRKRIKLNWTNEKGKMEEEMVHIVTSTHKGHFVTKTGESTGEK
jgi:hypothetical protein